MSSNPKATSSDRSDNNRDPITGERPSHPVGTGVGSAGGAMAGAAAGSLFGPIGMMIGGSVGAVAGAAAGHSIGEQVNPTHELDYWRNEHRQRPYTKPSADFDKDYLPAYRLGIEQRNQADVAKAWDESVSKKLEAKWSAADTTSRLDWKDAQPAVRDAWNRTHQTFSVYAEADRRFDHAFGGDRPVNPQYGLADFRSAYRYGTYTRRAYPQVEWDDLQAEELALGWKKFSDGSTMPWDDASRAARAGWDAHPPSLYTSAE